MMRVQCRRSGGGLREIKCKKGGALRPHTAYLITGLIVDKQCETRPAKLNDGWTGPERQTMHTKREMNEVMNLIAGLVKRAAFEQRAEVLRRKF